MVFVFLSLPELPCKNERPVAPWEKNTPKENVPATMTLTSLCTGLIYPIMAFMGIFILAHVFNAPYLDIIDFVAIVITVILIILFASWGIALNYGVETL